MCDCNQETMVNAKRASEIPVQGCYTAYESMGMDKCKQISTRESLLHRLNRADEDRESVSRSLRILEAHPEFEDFIWLLRSGVI